MEDFAGQISLIPPKRPAIPVLGTPKRSHAAEVLYYNWCTYVYVSVSVYVYVYVKVYVCEYVYVYVYVWLYAYVSIDVEYKYISGIIGVEAGYSSVGDISVDASIEW